MDQYDYEYDDEYDDEDETQGGCYRVSFTPEYRGI
jgi:hypothetical protein